MSICRARGCYNSAMPMGVDNPKCLCGVCHESDEDSPVRLKPGPMNVDAEIVAKRNATRRANRAAKEAHYAEVVANSRGAS